MSLAAKHTELTRSRLDLTNGNNPRFNQPVFFTEKFTENFIDFNHLLNTFLIFEAYNYDTKCHSMSLMMKRKTEKTTIIFKDWEKKVPWVITYNQLITKEEDVSITDCKKFAESRTKSIKEHLQKQSLSQAPQYSRSPASKTGITSKPAVITPKTPQRTSVKNGKNLTPLSNRTPALRRASTTSNIDQTHAIPQLRCASALIQEKNSQHKDPIQLNFQMALDNLIALCRKPIEEYNQFVKNLENKKIPERNDHLEFTEEKKKKYIQAVEFEMEVKTNPNYHYIFPNFKKNIVTKPESAEKSFIQDQENIKNRYINVVLESEKSFLQQRSSEMIILESNLIRIYQSNKMAIEEKSKALSMKINEITQSIENKKNILKKIDVTSAIEEHSEIGSSILTPPAPSPQQEKVRYRTVGGGVDISTIKIPVNTIVNIKKETTIEEMESSIKELASDIKEKQKNIDALRQCIEIQRKTIQSKENQLKLLLEKDWDYQINIDKEPVEERPIEEIKVASQKETGMPVPPPPPMTSPDMASPTKETGMPLPPPPPPMTSPDMASPTKGSDIKTPPLVEAGQDNEALKKEEIEAKMKLGKDLANALVKRRVVARYEDNEEEDEEDEDDNENNEPQQKIEQQIKDKQKKLEEILDKYRKNLASKKNGEADEKKNAYQLEMERAKEEDRTPFDIHQLFNGLEELQNQLVPSLKKLMTEGKSKRKLPQKPNSFDEACYYDLILSAAIGKTLEKHLSPAVKADILIIRQFILQKINEANTKSISLDEKALFMNSLRDFYRGALEIRLSDETSLEDQKTNMENLAHNTFKHRHEGRRILADILMMISMIAGIGLVIGVGRLLSNRSFFFSAASVTTQREDDFKALLNNKEKDHCCRSPEVTEVEEAAKASLFRTAACT